MCPPCTINALAPTDAATSACSASILRPGMRSRLLVVATLMTYGACTYRSTLSALARFFSSAASPPGIVGTFLKSCGSPRKNCTRSALRADASLTGSFWPTCAPIFSMTSRYAAAVTVRRLLGSGGPALERVRYASIRAVSRREGTSGPEVELWECAPPSPSCLRRCCRRRQRVVRRRTSASRNPDTAGVSDQGHAEDQPLHRELDRDSVLADNGEHPAEQLGVVLQRGHRSHQGQRHRLA